jgi:hypothetical protein
MARDNTLLYLAVGAAAVWYLMRSMPSVLAPSPTGTPISWWIAMSGDPHTLTETSPRLTPPAAGYRPASEYELAQAGHPDVLDSP